jgi:uncharacterized membrane protein YccC
MVDLLALLTVPEAAVGTLLGLAAAAMVHWVAPPPEPVIVEAGLVALGFIAGLCLNRWNERSREDFD